MNTVSNDIDIDLPVRTVYDQWTQFEEYPAFMTGVEEVRQLDDEHLYWAVRVGGVERGFEAEITEQLPDERIAWKSTSGPKNAGVVTFHRLNDQQTRVRLQLEWEPEGFVEQVGAAMQIDDAQVADDLREFARLMENNGFATGAWRGTIE
ncbi:SRPBCC family protein [Leucobacter sp. GX24907]